MMMMSNPKPEEDDVELPGDEDPESAGGSAG